MAQALLLSAYEVAREKQIQENAAVLAAMGLGFNMDSPSADIASSQKPTAKRTKKKPTHAASRRSLRISNQVCILLWIVVLLHFG